MYLLACNWSACSWLAPCGTLNARSPMHHNHCIKSTCHDFSHIDMSRVHPFLISAVVLEVPAVGRAFVYACTCIHGRQLVRKHHRCPEASTSGINGRMIRRMMVAAIDLSIQQARQYTEKTAQLQQSPCGTCNTAIAIAGICSTSKRMSAVWQAPSGQLYQEKARCH